MSEERALYQVHPIRKETFLDAENWVSPTPEEIRELLRQAGLTRGQFSRLLGLNTGLKQKGRGTVRKWLDGLAPIPYAAWAVLAYEAGKGIIWSRSDIGSLPERSLDKEGKYKKPL